MATVERRRYRIRGTVQGVGYRPFVYAQATRLGLAGWVLNDAAGVVVEVEGESTVLDRLSALLSDEAPPLARVNSVETSPVPALGEVGFRILASPRGGAPAVPITPDVATCADCLCEMFDPANRRYRYPFINCTNCGPRYTIVLDVPYDRPATTMRAFRMCPACQAEYEDPADRRFHAQPIACPACGPRLEWRLGPWPASGATALKARPVISGEAALAATVQALDAGLVVAVKGLGGYHLAADATNGDAVSVLRRRKARDDKPFAVMVADVDQARRLGRIDQSAQAALTGPARPIVLVKRRPGAGVAEGVAPGLRDVGLMLPYTPLHHLLLHQLDRPLIMTSGNLSDEPIAHEDTDAAVRLGPMVDGICSHDRAIHIRCDDSVVRSDGGELRMLRRSRGFAPAPVALPVRVRRPVLAVGAMLKNTIAVARDDIVVPSHHIGDLEHEPTYRSFLQAVEHLPRLYGVKPEVVAHDLHPEYLSSKWAVDLDLETRPVQHHHAHIAACLVDNGRVGPVLGLAFDGLGWGSDGTLWGGEYLLADLDGFRRLAHLIPVGLPGGAAAIREPWRMAMAWAAAAGGHELAAQIGPSLDERWPEVLSLIESGRSMTTTSAGRLFDAVAALLGIRRRVTYEGQAAIELEGVATGGGAPLPVDISYGGLDPRPLIGALLDRLRNGEDRSVLSAAFHDSLALAAARLAVRLAAEQDLGTVALSGGVFQNTRFSATVAAAIEQAGLEVLTHRSLPANDGGISVGQAAIAALSG